ncbi:MAG: cytidine deaminase [Tissierellia bacterium]|nr:cytidine deaminase [Tissierellia bacterium]
MSSIQEDIKLALDNLKMSYSPYSNFSVSSVLVTKSGKRYAGVNIENAAFSPTICAERTSFAKAVSQGERDFDRIIILGGLDGKVEDYCSPCGVCRQVMMEFCDPETFDVVMAIDQDTYKVYKLKDLLPMGFGPFNLKDGK